MHHILPVGHKYPLFNAVGSSSAIQSENLQHAQPRASASAKKSNSALRTHAQGSSSNANQSGSNGKQKAQSSVPNKKENGKPLGLKLLDRISKPKVLPNHMDQIAYVPPI